MTFSIICIQIAECFINEETLEFAMNSEQLQVYRRQIGEKLLLNIGI